MKNINYTRHHIIPKSVGGTNHFDNIHGRRETYHKAHHILYVNKAPHEQLLQIVDLTGRAFNKVFSDDIMSVIDDYDLEDVYNHKCVRMQKLINSILDVN